jgi:hypothetical protein
MGAGQWRLSIPFQENGKGPAHEGLAVKIEEARRLHLNY